MTNHDNHQLHQVLTNFFSAKEESWNHIFAGKLMERGRELFQGGAVSKLTFVGDSHLMATVDGADRQDPALLLEKEFFASRCKCTEHEEYGVCKHVSALGVAIREEGKRLNVFALVPVKRAETPLAIAAPAKSFELREDEANQLVLRAPKDTPVDVLRACGFIGAYLQDDESVAQTCSGDQEFEWLRERIAAASGQGYVINFLSADSGAIVPISGRIRHKQSSFLFNAHGPKRMVTFERICRQDGNRHFKAVLVIQPNAVLLETGDIIVVDQGQENELRNQRVVFGNHADYFHRADTGTEMSSTEFNRGIRKISLRHLACHVLFERALVMSSNEPDAIQATQLNLERASVVVLIRENRTGDFDVSLDVRLGRWPLMTDELFSGLAMELREFRTRLPAEVGKHAFTWMLARAIQSLNPKSGSTPVEADLSAAADFDKRAARKWLDSALADWLSKDPECLICQPTDHQSWHRFKIPRAKIIALILSLWPLETRKDVANLDISFPLGRAALPSFLLKAVGICSQAGVELRLGKRRVTAATAEIDVEVQEARGSTGIPWFEYRGGVTCGDTVIPVRDWGKLIAGDLTLLGKGGTVVIPLLSKRAALEFIQSRLRRQSRFRSDVSSGDASKAPVLELLEWLSLERMGVKIKMPPHVRDLIKMLAGFREISAISVPSTFVGSLRDYQLKGVSWIHCLFRLGLGALLADEMGLGKTPQTIAFIALIVDLARRENRRILVVAPASVVANWKREFSAFCPSLKVEELKGAGHRILGSRKVDVVLATYDAVARRPAAFRKAPPFAVVLDEAQMCKNWNSKRRRAIAGLDRKFTLVLSGTPLENKVSEYVSLLDLALPGLARLHCKEGGLNINEWAAPFVLRRTKAQVLSALPKMTYVDVRLPLSACQQNLYDKFALEARKTMEKQEGEEGAIAILAGLLRLRQICVDPRLIMNLADEISPKIVATFDIVKKSLAGGEPILVFSQFTSALDLLEGELVGGKLPFLRLDGQTPRHKRGDIVNAFQTSDKPQAFLISLRAGGTGLNLTRATKVIMLDNWWNPAVDEQAIARAHRIGQDREVAVFRLLMEGTVEEKIIQLQVRKKSVFDDVVAGPTARRQANGGGLSREDFEFLLS